MGPVARKKIRRRCEAAIDRRQALLRPMPSAAHRGLRCSWTTASIDLASEHHSAVIALAFSAHYAAADALLRPLLEATAGAYWLTYQADHDWIQALSKTAMGASEKNVPPLNDLLRHLMPVFPEIDAFAESLHGGPASWLRQLTHGAAIQSSRQGFEGVWTEKEIGAQLLIADLLFVMAAMLRAVVHDVPELARVALQHRDALGKEGETLLGAASVSLPRRRLPEPLRDP